MSFFGIILFLALIINAYAQEEEKGAYQDTNIPVDDRVADLVFRMTLAEKISLSGIRKKMDGRAG